MSKVSRRHFLYGALLAGAIPRAGFGSVPSLKRLGYQSPNEKLNLAGIGAGGRARGVLRSCRSENIVALADVDWARAADGFREFDPARRYRDYREMLDKEQRHIDAVVVAIPDHCHAAAALACMELGKSVYLEKPLARTPYESRRLAEAARRYGVATQMGNQGYSHEATRVASEILWAGEIGDVREVHAWIGRANWPHGTALTTIPPPEPVPDTLDWDLWLGPAADRPFTTGGEAYQDEVNKFYQPYNWRAHFDFSTGGLIGDWGIHILGPANWGLQLGSPLSVECVKQEGTSPIAVPERMHIRWEFPARRAMPPVIVNWYVDYLNENGDAYTPPGMTLDQVRSIPREGPDFDGSGSERRREGQLGSGYNQIFVGDKGYLGTAGRGERVGLIPGERWADYSLPPQVLTRSPGHTADWLRACKGGERACSHFEIAARYNEWVTLGVIALHVPGRLLWDADRLEFTNSPEANEYVRPYMRRGWGF